MFYYSQEYFQAYTDARSRQLGVNPQTVYDHIPRVLDANSDAKYFDILLQQCDQAELPTLSDEERHFAAAALLQAPFQYPDNPVRSIAGAAYALRAVNWDLTDDNPATKHRNLFEEDIALTIPGFDLGSLDRFGTVCRDEAVNYLYGSYFSLAELLYQGGPNALRNLTANYGVTQFADYPTHILVDQLTNPKSTVPEVPIYVSVSEPHDGDPKIPDPVYQKIADAAEMAGARPVIFEFNPDFDDCFFDFMLAVKNPLIGFIDGHGNHDNIGGLDALDLIDVTDTGKRAIRNRWRRSAGVVAMSCYSVSVSEELDEPVARDLADIVGRPIAGSADAVIDVDVAYSRRAVRPTWTIGFHAAPDAGKVHGIVEPQKFSSAPKGVVHRLRATTVPNPDYNLSA